ncbi:MAG: polysaccharide biosynthesis tyrosine autokinase [Planctomycetota bacterium]
MENYPLQPGPNQFVVAPPGMESEERGFDFWGVLSRRKWLVFLGLVTGMALGGLYGAQCKDVYKSEAKVRIEPKDPMVIFQTVHQKAMLPGAKDLAIRHDQLIGQPNIVRKCLNNNGLTGLGSFADLPEEEIVTDVVDNLEVTQNKEEIMLYDLQFYSSKPDDAQTLLNNLIATYEKDLEEQYKDESENVETLISALHESFNSEYQNLQKKKQKLQGTLNSVEITDGRLNFHQVKVRELGAEIQDAKTQLGFLMEDQRRAESYVGSPVSEIEGYIWILENEKKIIVKEEEPFVQDERLIENAIMEQRKLQTDLDQVSRQLGDGHWRVRSLKKAIADYQNLIDGGSKVDNEVKKAEPQEILRRYMQSLAQQISDLQKTISRISPELNNHHEEALAIAAKKRQIEDVKLDIEKITDFMQTTKQKLIDIGSGDTGRNRHEGFRFQTLMNASYGKRVWPIIPLILGLGGFLGSLVGFGLGCLVELADQTFHNPDEIMKQLNMPLIGHVPVIGSSKRYLVENSLIDPMVCCYHRPKSQVSEAFRAVRTALYFNTQGKQHSVIQVTSPTPGDGKSTLAANLAVSIAQSGKKVLLVDSDMRRPRQHSKFGIEAREGFATVLSGHSDWQEVLYECEEIEGLTVMPCGAKPNNPAELSSSPQVKILLEEMRQRFDFIIVDTPPLLAVTDACPIAARVDGVVLCLRIKKNVKISASRAIEMLQNLGANCIGLVVNGVGAQSGYGSQYTYGAYRAGYSYNGYGYGYGYGAGKYYDEDRKGRKAVMAPKHLENSPERGVNTPSQIPPVT